MTADPGSLEHQALELLKRGDLPGAHRTLNELLALRPNDQALRARIRQIEAIMQQRAEAQARIHAEPLRYAHAYIKAGRLTEGLQLLRGALARDPNNQRLRELALEVARRLQAQVQAQQADPKVGSMPQVETAPPAPPARGAPPLRPPVASPTPHLRAVEDAPRPLSMRDTVEMEQPGYAIPTPSSDGDLGRPRPAVPQASAPQPSVPPQLPRRSGAPATGPVAVRPSQPTPGSGTGDLGHARGPGSGTGDLGHARSPGSKTGDLGHARGPAAPTRGGTADLPLVRNETDERTRREAFERAKREVEEKKRREAEERARREAEERARKEAEERARRENFERIKREAEERTRREVAERARREAEERAKREAEERAKREAEERAKREAEERAKREAEERARREAEERARREAEERAKREAEERARREAEERAKREAEERATREAEERATREAEAGAAAWAGWGAQVPGSPVTPAAARPHVVPFEGVSMRQEGPGRSGGSLAQADLREPSDPKIRRIRALEALVHRIRERRRAI